MTHGSLFSGIGGFDLAAEWMGWENKFHCEINPFGQRVLKYYWPDSISYHDIKTTDFSIWRGKIDILSGGFPCQPYSTAGKRKGKEDDRHLWPEMLRAIREIQPRWIVGENVRGLTNWNGGLVFDEVQADLEAEGYEVLPFLLPACGVGAPHRRDRIWFIAYSVGNGYKHESGESGQSSEEIEGSKYRKGRNEVHREWNGGNIKRTDASEFAADSDLINGRTGTGGENGKEIDNSNINDPNSNCIGLQGGGSSNGCEPTERYAGSLSGGAGQSAWTLLPFLINHVSQKEQEHTENGETNQSKHTATQ